VRAVQTSDDVAAELASVRREFQTKDADVDTASALIHQKACVVLAASRKPLTDGYDDAFIAEVTSCARLLGSDSYHPRGA
jgi:hypothetical protein